MHILLIHQAFVSSQEAGGTRHYELARHLVQQGHHFTVIASNINYLSGKIIENSTKRWMIRQAKDGIDIWRTWAYGRLHRTFFERALSFATYSASSFVAGLNVSDVDVVIGTYPPLLQGLTAYAIAKLRRRPFVFEVRDLWMEYAIQAGYVTNPAMIRALRLLETFLCHHAQMVIVNSPGYIPYLVRRGVSESRIELVPNGVDAGMFDPRDRGVLVREKFGLGEKFVALYAGAHGPINDLQTLLQAADLLRDQPEICFVLVGDGKEKARLMRLTAEMGLENVVFVPPVPKSEIPSYLAAADVCIAILGAYDLLKTVYPNKVFDYMAAGRPVVLAIDGVIRQVVESAEAGLFVPPGDPVALAGAIKSLQVRSDTRREMGWNGRSFVCQHFERRKQAEKLSRLLEEVCSGEDA